MRQLPLDLSDLSKVVTASARIEELAGGTPVEVLVANAGVIPAAYSTSAQGHELAFATNTLGHHCLVRRLLARKLLAEQVRVVILTGDLYIRAKACTPDFKYDGGGVAAYCRSKLGNIWFACELQRHYPELEVVTVHPGVIFTGLTRPQGFGATMQRLMLLDVVAGAQATLFCATQPGLGGAAYFHNTHGRMILSEKDPAANAGAARELWATLEQLTTAFR